MSTATLVVEVAKSAVGKWGTAGGKLRRKPQGGREVSDSCGLLSCALRMMRSWLDVHATKSIPDAFSIQGINRYHAAQDHAALHAAWQIVPFDRKVVAQIMSAR